MLAARDQENIVHAQQSAAAAKSLNQGIRTLRPKTPSNLKTPFRYGLNDENRYLDIKGQKTAGRDGPSKLNSDLFVTPGPRRDRAPLGQKTTNAKGAAFKTPAPLQHLKHPGQTIKRSSTTRRSAKSKIHVATEPLPAAVIDEHPASDSEPEYGYAPPKVPDLADPPLEITYDETFPMFRGKDLFNGFGQTYCTSPTDDRGISIREKEEKRRAIRLREDRLKEADIAAAEATKPVLPADDELDSRVDEMMARVPRSRKDMGVATVQARSAAAVLSDCSARPKLPAAATKQTAASALKRHEPTASLPSRPRSRQLAPSHPGPRMNVSKNTIGFPKAKPPPSIAPKFSRPLQTKPAPKADNAKISQDDIHPKADKTTISQDDIHPKADKTTISQDDIHPKDFVKLYGRPPVGSRMHERLLRHELLEQELKVEEQEAEVPQAPLFDDLDELLRGDFACAEDDDLFQLELSA
ncbi:hypothetical protein DV735_g793, partial [Chaetothyriales sp. CBS 134920]